MANGDQNQGKINISLPFDTSSIFGALGGQQQPQGQGPLLAPQPTQVAQNTLTPATVDKPSVAPSANLPAPPSAQAAPPSAQTEPSAQDLLRGNLGGPSPEQQELQQLLAQQFQKQQEDRRGTIGQLEQSLERQAGADQGPNKALAVGNALARFSDAFFDTNIAKSLPKAETQAERENRLNVLRQAISKEKGSLANSEVAFLKNAIKESGGGSAELRLLNSLRRGEQFQTRRADKAQERIFKSQEKIDKDFRTDKQQFDTLDASLARGDYQSVMATLGQFARAVSGERGVLTDNDINRVIPKNIQGDAAKIEAYFSNTPSAAITTDFVKNLRELVEIAKNKSRNKHVEGLDFLKGRIKNQPVFAPARKDLLFDIDSQKEEIFKLIPKSELEIKKERLEELRRKAGK